MHMKTIGTAYADMLKEDSQYKTQQMITDRNGMFADLGKKEFTPHLIKIMNGSSQILCIMQYNVIKLILRCKVKNEEDKFWLAICSDGTRNNSFESDGVLKLITLYRVRKDRADLEKNSVKHWLSLESSVIVSEIGEQQGTFIQFDSETIESENHLLLKMFRAMKPNKSDDELKEIMRSKISLTESSTKKKNMYLFHTPDPLKQRKIDTSVFNKSDANHLKRSELSTSSSAYGKLFGNKKTSSGNRENGEQRNKFANGSSCSLQEPLSRSSSMLSMSSQHTDTSKNSSKSSLNLSVSPNKERRNNRNRKGREGRKEEISTGVEIAKAESKFHSFKESTDSDSSYVAEKTRDDERFDKRLKEFKAETEGILKNNW